MSTTTKPRQTAAPDADVLEDLDFDYECEVSTSLMLLNRFEIPLRDCHAAAVWAGNFPCCGGKFLVCARHREGAKHDFYVCRKCEREWPFLMRWRRI